MMIFRRAMKMILLAAVLFVASASFADFLWWQVISNDPISGAPTGVDTFIGANGASLAIVDGDGQITYANLYYDTGTEYKPVVKDGDATWMTTEPLPEESGKNIYNTGELLADIGELNENYSYFIELVNYDEAGGSFTQIATSEQKTYTEIYRHITSQMTTAGMEAPWHGTGFSGAVPEPTSGALLLLGAGLAAFKKRRNLKDLLKRKA